MMFDISIEQLLKLNLKYITYYQLITLFNQFYILNIYFIY